MSELINAKDSHNDFRRRLLTTVSALALAGSLSTMPDAKADDEMDRPTLWIELGGQMERMDGTGEPYAPAFISTYADSNVFTPVSPAVADKAPLFAFGEESRISFEPAGTNWVLSAAMLYGRSNGDNHAHYQVTPSGKAIKDPFVYPSGLVGRANFADTRAPQYQSHMIVDFQAGKDFGLGMLGKNSSSVFSLGVRYAQFASNAHINIEARPDLQGHKYLSKYWHAYTAAAQSDRSFHGIGPSLSWHASKAIVGNDDNGKVALDWGLTGAVLFGRQKAKVSHNTRARLHSGLYYHYTDLYYHNTPVPARAKFVTVPNVGGFAGISFSRSVAKISFGYRGEMFFGAVDGGWDAAHRENLSFHGPYATISIGLGG